MNDQCKDIYNDISRCLGLYSDNIMTERFFTITPEFARGYINSFSIHSDNNLAILTYFVIELLVKKMQ